MQRLLLMVLFCAVLAPAQSIQDFFRQAFEERLRDEPEFATGVGHHEYDDRWTDWSKGARDERRRFFEEHLAQLNSAQVGDAAKDLLTRRLVRYDFESRLEAWELDTHLLRVGQSINGFHNLVYSVIDQMPAFLTACKNTVPAVFGPVAEKLSAAVPALPLSATLL